MSRSRLALIFAFIGITLFGALSYAGPNAPVVIYRLLTDGAMLSAWLIAAGGIGGVLLRWILPQGGQRAGRLTPSPGTPGEGGGGGSASLVHGKDEAATNNQKTPTPTLPRSTGRGSNTGTSGLMQFVSSTALGLGIISLLTLGLGLAGLLNRGSAIGIICGGILLALLLALQQQARFSDCMAWAKQSAGWNWLLIAACPFAAIALVAAMLPAGILWRPGDPSFYDVVEYHLQVPREWFEAGRIIPIPHNVFSFFPMNVEMHYLLAMHLCGGPWAGMYLAQLMHLAFIALFVVAVYAFALEIVAGSLRRLTPSGTPGEGWGEGDFESSNAPASLWQGHPARPDDTEQKNDSVSSNPRSATQPTRAGSPCHGGALGAVTAALAVATVPWITQLAPVAYDEGGFLFFGTLAIAWVCLAISEQTQRIGRLIIAGGLAGFACGAKLTAVPEVLLALTAICGMSLLVRKRESAWKSARAALLFLAVGLLTFSPWLARNQKWAGNPLFPEATKLLGPGNFTPVQIERWQRAHSARPDQQNLSARLHAGASEILASRQYGYALIPLGLISALLARQRRITVLLGAMFLAVTLIWLFATHLEGRFFVLAIPLCAWMIAQIQRPALAASALAIVLASALVSGTRLHRDLSVLLHGGRESPLGPATVKLLGVEDISFLEAAYLDGLTPDQHVVLIGDAKAFFYTIPMSHLHYRTVFDVRKDTGNLIEDWNDGPLPRGARVIVDPEELRRFHRTYWKTPPVPAWVEQSAPGDQNGQRLPFIVAGSGK